MNYPANAYPFRQDSSFLYYFGLDLPGLAAAVDIEGETEVLLGNDVSLEDIIWTGPLPSVRELGQRAGVKRAAPLAQLSEIVAEARRKKRPVHYLPPYRMEQALRLADLLSCPVSMVKSRASKQLIQTVVAQRSIKSPEEIQEIESALRITYRMYIAAMKMTRPGIYEREIVGAIEGLALASGCMTAFPTILTMNGHIFHHHGHEHRLKKGRLLVIDSGAASPSGYASDITRTIPVSGRFSVQQKEIYEIVLAAQLKAISMAGPGIKYRDVHLAAARVIAAGLKDLGLMKGDTEEAVSLGAHALFFPHGLGHMLGLDVHDMESLGENFVGYDETTRRSDQFGLAYLRLARRLEPGFVLTCEPGIYFIPALIDQWKKDRRFVDFINYDRVESYRNFTGIRIEDDLLITKEGNRVLGRPIPKRIHEVQKAMSGGEQEN